MKSSQRHGKLDFSSGTCRAMPCWKNSLLFFLWLLSVITVGGNMAIKQEVDQTINGNLITELATSIATSSDTNASSHDKLWLEVRSLFEKEPMAKTKTEVKDTCNRVWDAVESYIVEGHHVARKKFYEADPKKYATQFLKVDSQGQFMAVPSDKGLHFSSIGGFETYQLGKDYELSFAECFEMDKATYSALPYNKEDGTDKHRFGAAGESLQGFMEANRVKQQDYMSQKKTNVIKGWKKRYKKYCGVVTPQPDPKLWEDDLKAELVKTSDFYIQAKKSGKHMSTKKREKWDTWFKTCPVDLSSEDAKSSKS